MNIKRLSIMAIGGALLCGAVSCSKSRNGNMDSTSENTKISSVPFAFDLKNAKKCYEISSIDDTTKYTLSIEATVLWPEKIDGYDLASLQDTIINLIAGKHVPTIDEAILSYVGNAAVYELGDKITEIDSVPAISPFNTAFYAQTDITIPEISTDMITIRCVTDQYLGGAHNMTGSTVLTYDLKNGIFISNKWLFKDTESPELLNAIKESIAAETNMTIAELEQTKLVTEIPIPDDVYLQDGMIVFHYNPYAVLPYSFGTIDASVSPYLIKDLLTPAAQKMLASE